MTTSRNEVITCTVFGSCNPSSHAQFPLATLNLHHRPKSISAPFLPDCTSQLQRYAGHVIAQRLTLSLLYKTIVGGHSVTKLSTSNPTLFFLPGRSKLRVSDKCCGASDKISRGILFHPLPLAIARNTRPSMRFPETVTCGS